MHTRSRTRALSARPHRTARARRVIRPMAGQCFEIEIHQDAGSWEVRIPEIGATAEASARAGVELAARECIAANTGIPLGYISVWVRD